MGRLEVIIQYIKDNPDLTNADIARKLQKEKGEYFRNWNLDSIRRKVSKIRAKMGEKAPPPPLGEKDSPFTWKQDGRNATASALTDERITSLEDLVAFFNVDLRKWRVKKWECSSYESHPRMRRYDITFKTKVGYARLDDEHKVVPLYRVWAQLEENTPVILLDETKDEILEEIKNHSPKYPRISYPKIDKKKGYLFEVNIFDLHFGKLTWDEETGESFDIKIARELFLTCLGQLMQQAANYPIKRILFPIGNDFFNTDNANNTTFKGTPQDEDTRWKKTFTRGRKLIVEAVDRLRELAPVDVVVVPGNHDLTRVFYLGDAVECWYNNVPEVAVDNGPKVRKYYRWGKNLIGYTHGSEERVVDLPYIMANEEPKLWAETLYREWHIGDKHHKKEIKWMSTEEFKGVTVRYMRSLTSTDAWHFHKGFVSALRAGEGFIWDEENGLVCAFSANI